MGRVSAHDRERIKQECKIKYNADVARVKLKKERKEARKKAKRVAYNTGTKDTHKMLSVWDNITSIDMVEELKQEAIEVFLDQQEGHTIPALDDTKRVDFTDDDGDFLSLQLKPGKKGDPVIKIFVNGQPNKTYPVVQNEVIAESKTGTIHLGPDSCVLPPSERYKLAAIEQLCANAAGDFEQSATDHCIYAVTDNISDCVYTVFGSDSYLFSAVHRRGQPAWLFVFYQTSRRAFHSARGLRSFHISRLHS